MESSGELKKYRCLGPTTEALQQAIALSPVFSLCFACFLLPPPSSLLPPPSSLLLPPPFFFSLKAPKTILTCSQGREPPSHRAGAVTSQPRGRQEMEMIEGGWLGSIVKQKPQLHPKRVVPTQLVNSCLVGTKFILANPSDTLREVRNNYLNMRSSDF